MDARTFERIAVGAERLLPVDGPAAATGLARTLRGHLPEVVDSPRAQHTLDTAENRFVRAFLDQADAVVGRVERRATCEVIVRLLEAHRRRLREHA